MRSSRVNPADDPTTFTNEVYDLLRKHGWYYNNGFREKVNPDRGLMPGLSAGQVVDELMRRDVAAVSKAVSRAAEAQTERARKAERAGRKAAESQLAACRKAVERIRDNALSWHGPVYEENRHAKALAVIAEWCDRALSGQEGDGA